MEGGLVLRQSSGSLPTSARKEAVEPVPTCIPFLVPTGTPLLVRLLQPWVLVQPCMPIISPRFERLYQGVGEICPGPGQWHRPSFLWGGTGVPVHSGTRVDIEGDANQDDGPGPWSGEVELAPACMPHCVVALVLPPSLYLSQNKRFSYLPALMAFVCFIRLIRDILGFSGSG